MMPSRGAVEMEMNSEMRRRRKLSDFVTKTEEEDGEEMLILSKIKEFNLRIESQSDCTCSGRVSESASIILLMAEARRRGEEPNVSSSFLQKVSKKFSSLSL